MGVKQAFLGKLLSSSDRFSDEQVAQTISLLVENGVKHRASDIHIEPHDRFVQVRYRVDNVLRSIYKLPLAALPIVTAQIKELAHLKIEEDTLPQEGQYAALVGDEQFEVQVYTIPVIGGEKVVMHISRRLSEPPTLQRLGFWGQSLTSLQDALSYTHGLVIVAAPRRNGKTTTLHSLLQILNTPTASLATIESAIEYRVPGASQTRVRPGKGINFYDGLCAALNQDPNVILVGDLGDKPTSNLTIQAATGGHLILAGMHADNAAAAVARLQRMSEEVFLFATAMRVVVSQRLIRKLCTACRQQYAPSRQEAGEIEKAFGITSASAKQKLHLLEQQAIGAGMGDKIAHTLPAGIISLWRASEEGCESCNHSGFQGTLGINEVLSTSSVSMQDLLLQSVTEESVRRAALKDGFIPMELDGLIKALRGQTTIAEILRILAVQ